MKLNFFKLIYLIIKYIHIIQSIDMLSWCISTYIQYMNGIFAIRTTIKK